MEYSYVSIFKLQFMKTRKCTHSPTNVNVDGIRTQILYDEKKKEDFMKMFILRTKFKLNVEYCIGYSINQMP